MEAALLTNLADLLRASEAMKRAKAAVAMLADIGADPSEVAPNS